MESEIDSIKKQLRALVVFRHIHKDPVIQALMEMLESIDKGENERIDAYAAFTHRLFTRTENLTEYIWEKVLSDENLYVRKKASREKISENLADCIFNELMTLQRIAELPAGILIADIDKEVRLPKWICTEMDFAAAYEERMSQLFTRGFGMYAEHSMFVYSKGEILPVKNSDRVKLSSLSGYNDERQTVVQNTLAFLHNKPVANVLLYGDAGTGKSSTVKAVVNEFYEQGLRMVEIKKGDLLEIPQLLEMLAKNPLKFILFLDDLSFSESNEEVGALKAVLEGSVLTKAPNTVIYATSNRRHLVKETFSDREGNDIHRNETIQEQISLSDRFGLSVRFARPDREEYLKIVHGLAKEYQIEDMPNLDMLADQHAIQRGGRSARAARHFIEQLFMKEEKIQ